MNRVRMELMPQSGNVSGNTLPHPSLGAVIVAIACASISLLAASMTIWWFALMKRRLRHHLIMLLIISDMGKALWFFVGPLVVLVNGPVKSSSSFCQASGFFLAWATEASDFSALMLALHLVTCVFRPAKGGHRGLYKLRRWIFSLWVVLPLLAASLAFVNAHHGYASYGAFCYLPEMPIWYRLALAWIPRYIVLITIFSVAITITMHVHIKYRRIRHLGRGDLEAHLDSEGSKSATGSLSNNSLSHNQDLPALPVTSEMPVTISWQHSFNPSTPPRRGSTIRDFASSPPLILNDHVINTSDFRRPMSGLSSPDQTTLSRNHSSTTDTTRDDLHDSSRAQSSATDSTEELLAHRHAIEKQVRLLFIYPTSYMLVWTFPFVSQCFQLTGSNFQAQPLWLRILTTAVLASQAGVDAAVFCYRERPWKRAKGRAPVLLDKIRRWKYWNSASRDSNMRETEQGISRRTTNQENANDSARSSVCWWEEEGKKRRDSVWMGTDTLATIKSRQERDIETTKEEGRPSSSDTV